MGKLVGRLGRLAISRRAVVVGSVTLLLLLGGGFAHYYRGLTLHMMNQWRDTGLQETRNLVEFIFYWSSFIEKLHLNEETGYYGFGEQAMAEQSQFERGLLAYHQGNFALAITAIEGAIELHGASEERLFWLANSYLRQGEAENCLSALVGDGKGVQAATPHGDHKGEMCALPLGQFHDRAASSRKAALLFEQLLEERPDDKLYKWLLNFAYMTVGGYPHEVPEQHRIRSPFIEHFYGDTKRRTSSRYSHLAFEDRAQQLNVDVLDAGKGVAVEDFDGDGFLDIVTGGTFESVRYLANQGGVSFVDRTEEAGLSGVVQPHTITAADYDNDGWMDLFVGGFFHRFALFRNLGNGTFADVTSDSGLFAGREEEESTMTWTSAWGDVDNDGDLDLFVGQLSVRVPLFGGILAAPRMDSKLYLNEDGSFVDRTEEYGLGGYVREQAIIGSAFGDYDDDGDVDLFLSSSLRGSGSVLLNNVGGKRFEKMNQLERRAPGFTAAFVDVNHDGRLDLFQGASVPEARTSVERAVFGAPHPDPFGAGHSALFLQDPDGRFRERRELFEDEMPMGTMGTSYGDLNNDGCFDFYLGTGGPEGWFILPNLLYIGQTDGKRCTGRMTNASMLHGFGTIQKGHGIAFFDFDNDGDQDIYSSLGGLWPGDPWPNQLFVNDSRLENSWIKIRLRGRKVNRFGVGAKIRVTAADAQGTEIVRRAHMDHKTGFGSSPYLAHIGLLDAVSIEEIEVTWPGNGCRRAYYAGQLNTLNVLDEKVCSETSNPSSNRG